MSNKLLLIISGEAFREGGQGSRKKDTEKSIESQTLASESHVKFIKNLYDKYKISCDVQLLSYGSKYENILIEKYNPYNLTYHFNNKYHRDRTTLTNANKIDNIHNKYLGILVIRPDMYLKQYFIDKFNPFIEQVNYISVCFLYYHVCHKNIPRINDASIFIPNKYFSQIYYDIGIKLYHEAIADYLGHGMTLNDFNFLLPTLHDSDSAKDYNPFFYLVSRHQNLVWHSYGYEINNLSFLPELTYKKYDYPDWNVKNNIKHEQNYNDIEYNKLWEWWHQNPNKFFEFINLIKIDTNLNNTDYISTIPQRHSDESYWRLEDDTKLTFYDNLHNPTAILYRNSDKEFIGGSIKHNYKFMLRKLL